MTAEQDTPRATGPAPAAAGSTGNMPLGARRLFMIGALSVPVGLVAGPYVLGGPLLAIAGIVMVAAALSYSDEGPWFSRWSWAATAAGALWLAATAAYWGSVIAAGDAGAPPPEFAPGLFTAGLVCFGIMAVCSVVAMMLRAVRARGRRPAAV